MFSPPQNSPKPRRRRLQGSAATAGQPTPRPSPQAAPARPTPRVSPPSSPPPADPAPETREDSPALALLSDPGAGAPQTALYDLRPQFDAPTPQLPPELADPLNARELRTVWLMVAGRTYAQALDECNIPPRAALRDSGPPPYVRAAVDELIRQVAASCAISRTWILINLVAIYRRASMGEPVVDRRGARTGEWRFDGSTAVKCLELLGNQAGMFGKRVVHDVPNEVRDLMRAVAARGRPALGAHGRPRLVGSDDATPQTAD